MTLFITIGVVFFIMAIMFGKSQLAKTARNRVSDIGDTITKTIADPIKDGEADIKEAHKELDSLNSTIAELITETFKLKHRVDNYTADVAKYENIAIAAGKAGDKDGVTQAVNLKKTAETQATTLQKEVAKNTTLEAQLREQVSLLSHKIENAENSKVRLSAILTSSNLRETIAKKAAGVGTANGLAALDNITNAADNAEAKAEAWEKIAATSTSGSAQTLEKKYATPAVTDDEISKYLIK